MLYFLNRKNFLRFRKCTKWFVSQLFLYIIHLLIWRTRNWNSDFLTRIIFPLTIREGHSVTSEKIFILVRFLNIPLKIFQNSFQHVHFLEEQKEYSKRMERYVTFYIVSQISASHNNFKVCIYVISKRLYAFIEVWIKYWRPSFPSYFLHVVLRTATFLYTRLLVNIFGCSSAFRICYRAFEKMNEVQYSVLFPNKLD